MAKSKAQKRKRVAIADAPSKLQKTAGGGIITPPPDLDAGTNDRGDATKGGKELEPTSLKSVVSEEELEITIETLTELARYPGLLKKKEARELRGAVWEFRKTCTVGGVSAEDTNLTARISAALVDAKYTEARILLAEMKIRNEMPKLGALCRWVRDLDMVSGLAIGRTKIDRSAREKEVLLVMDAILRVTGPTDDSPMQKCTDEPIAVQEAWNLRDEGRTVHRVHDSVLDKSILGNIKESIVRKYKVLETTLGLQRKPPNHHPAILYISEDNAVALANPAPAPTRTRHEHPVVPNLSLIKNVLSPEECKAIIAGGEAVEFIPDAPIRDDGEEVSVLAHNFYWIIDSAFHTRLWDRVKEYVPASVGGRKVRGLNRRFRVYRYVPGAEYRCHIDGAWPPSGISPLGKYVYDSSAPDKRQSSLFTFLIYLNDEFEGGETTFFLPSRKEGVLNAYPVKPIMGGVAVFPHGETEGVILHEGTGVRKGAKYVIRTEVEYDVESSED